MAGSVREARLLLAELDADIEKHGWCRQGGTQTTLSSCGEAARMHRAQTNSNRKSVL